MKKLTIVIFLILTSIINGKIVENFENYSISLIDTYNIRGVSLVNYFASNRGNSLSIDRYIGTYKQCSNAAYWSEISEVKINFSSIQDWQNYKYFVLYFRDLANINGNGSKTVQIGLYDGDEYYFHDVVYSDGDWHQIIVYLKDMGLGSPFVDPCSGDTSYNNDTKGLTLPLWEVNDHTYTGNGVLNLNSMSMLKLSFGSDKLIDGEFIVDDVKVINEVSKSTPFFYKNYITYMKSFSNLSLYFGETMDETTLTTNNIKLLGNGLPISYSLNYNSTSNKLSVPFTPLSGVLYSLNLTNAIKFKSGLSFMSNVSYQFKIDSSIKLGKTSGVFYDSTTKIGLVIQSNSLNDDVSFGITKSENTQYDNDNYKNIMSIRIQPDVNFQKTLSCYVPIEETGNIKVYQIANGALEERDSAFDEESKILSFKFEKSGEFLIEKVKNNNLIIQNDYIKIKNIENKIFNPEIDVVKIHLDVTGVSKMRYRILDENGVVLYEYEGNLLDTIQWEGKDLQKRVLNSGVYIFEITVYNNRDNVEEFFGWTENKGLSQTIKVPVFLYK